jgi:hypothetical protein
MNNSTIVKVDFDQIKQNLHKKQQEKLACRRQHQSTQKNKKQFKANNQILAKNKKINQKLNFAFCGSK